MKKLHLQILMSRQDIYGNCYFAFEAYHPETGKTAAGKISGAASNIRAAQLALLGHWPSPGEDRWHIIEAELPIRQFNRRTKGWAHAGCTPDEILAFIKAGCQ